MLRACGVLRCRVPGALVMWCTRYLSACFSVERDVVPGLEAGQRSIAVARHVGWSLSASSGGGGKISTSGGFRAGERREKC